MKSICVILNPIAGRGFSAKAEPVIQDQLQNSQSPFEIWRTEAVGHGITLAEKAVRQGFDIVVAAGGDGTANEVINGLLNSNSDMHNSTFGSLPTGSGSDFSYNLGIPTHLEQACQRLMDGQIKKVDIGKITVPDQPPRYFDNQLGIGFDGIVTVEAKKYKRLRGMALYLPVVLKTVFLTHGAIPVTITCNDQIMDISVVQISIANGAREGGGFYMTPEAKIDDGLFDVLIVNDVSKIGMLKLIPHFTKGTHTTLDCAAIHRTTKITIQSDHNLIAHFDGEMLCTEGHDITCEIIPQCLSVIC